jgi:hypothetical protein
LSWSEGLRERAVKPVSADMYVGKRGFKVNYMHQMNVTKFYRYEAQVHDDDDGEARVRVSGELDAIG